MAIVPATISFLLLGTCAEVFAVSGVRTGATTIATLNTGLIAGTVGNVDARATVLIDQVLLYRTNHSMNVGCR